MSELQGGAFRVFDLQAQRYADRSEPFCLLPDGRLFQWIGAPQLTQTDAAVLLSTSPGRYAVERWTGLRDSTGKPMFEGDLLKSSNLGKGLLYRIIWDERWACFSLRIWPDNAFSDASVYGNHVEVVGTIHNDPVDLEKRAREVSGG